MSERTPGVIVYDDPWTPERKAWWAEFMRPLSPEDIAARKIAAKAAADLYDREYRAFVRENPFLAPPSKHARR